MTEKFEAFKAALDALCVEHGVRMVIGCDYDQEFSEVHVEPASDEDPAGLHLDLVELIPPTPEEIAAEEARRAAAQAEWNAKWAANWDGSYMKQHFARLDAMSLEEKQAMIAANAEEQRKKHMRVTRIPGDFHDIGDRPCRVWCNEVEIEGWTVADDFRRVVETPGKVHHGAVRIDLAPVALPVVNEGEEAFVPMAEDAKPIPVKQNIHIPARKRKAGK